MAPRRGLGLSSHYVDPKADQETQDYQARNLEYGAPSDADAGRWEDRNARYKRGTDRAPYGYPDFKSEASRNQRRQRYQEMAVEDPSWGPSERQNGAVQFEEDFKAAMDEVPGIYDDPDDYSQVNYKRWEPLAQQWRRRARRYGLSEEEADEIMNQFAED